jgi:hypothetical protein
MARVSFESDLTTPTFYVWLDGALFGSTQASYMDVPLGIGQVAQIDVFDDSGDVPAAIFPSTVSMLWDVWDGVAVSRVEQWDGAAWLVRASIPMGKTGSFAWCWWMPRAGTDWRGNLRAPCAAGRMRPRAPFRWTLENLLSRDGAPELRIMNYEL